MGSTSGSGSTFYTDTVAAKWYGYGGGALVNAVWDVVVWGYEGVHYLWEGEARHFIIPKGSGLYLLLLSLLLSWVADFLVHQGVCRHGACGRNLFLLFGPALATLVAYFFVSPPLPIYTAYEPSPIFFKPLVKFLRFRGGTSRRKEQPCMWHFFAVRRRPFVAKVPRLIAVGAPACPAYSPLQGVCATWRAFAKILQGFFCQIFGCAPAGLKAQGLLGAAGVGVQPGCKPVQSKKKGPFTVARLVFSACAPLVERLGDPFPVCPPPLGHLFFSWGGDDRARISTSS